MNIRARLLSTVLGSSLLVAGAMGYAQAGEAGPKMAAMPVDAVDAAPIATNDMANKLISDNLVYDRSSTLKPAARVAPAASSTDDQLQTLHEENAKLRTALETERRTYENKLLKQDKDSSFVAELNEKVGTLQKQNDDLRHQLASAAKAAVPATVVGATVQALQADNAHLKAQVETLKSEVADAKAKIPSVTDAQKLAATNQQLAEANKKLAQLQDQVAQADKVKSDLAQQQSAAATTADQKLADANQKLAAADKKLAAADQKTAEAAKMMQQASALQQTTQQTVQQTVQQANQKVAAVNATGADTERKLKEAADKLTAADRQEAEAAQKLDQANAKAATAEQKLAEANQKLLDAAQKRPAIASPVVDKQQAALVVSLQGQLQALQTENAGLKDSLKTAQAAPAAPAVDNGALAQLHAVQQQLASAEEDRARLKHQVEALSAGGNQRVINVATTDWNLEEATRRYNEEERQIRAMGIQLEQQRGICEAEKKKIEYQLFDPAIATQAQIQKVSSLEQQIDQTKAELAAEHQRVAALEAKSPSATNAVVTTIRTNTASPQPAGFVQPKVTPPAAKPESPETAALDPLPLPEKDQANDLTAIPTAAGAANAPVARDGLAVGEISKRDISVTPLPPPAVANAAPAPATAPVFSPAKVAQATNALIDTPRPAAGSADLPTLLSQAIPLNGGVSKVPGPARSGFANYKWQSGALSGNAEQQPLGGPAAFDTHVADYLAKTRSHCKGSFAAKPGAAQTQADIRTAAYEVACVGKADSAVSLLFFSQNGRFTTIAHAGSVDNMDAAMDARDKILSKILQTKVASN